MQVDFRKEFRVYLEFRKHMPAVDVVLFDLAEHFQRVGYGLRVVGKEFGHLLLALQELLLRISQSLGVVDCGIGGQADEPVVCGTVLLVDEMHVVGGDHLDSVLPAELEYARAIFLLPLVDFERQAGNFGLVEHDFEIVVVAEHALVPSYRLVQGVVVSCEYVSRNLSGHAGGAADQAFVVLLQDFVAHPWLVVHALDMAGGDDLH